MEKESELEQHLRIGRQILVGWPGSRPQTTQDIAERCQTMVRRLTEIGVIQTVAIWALFDRPPRSKEPVISAMSAADLGTLIDRKGRFDPPPWPQPVGPEGYSFLVNTYEAPRVQTRVDISLRVGSSHPSYENSVSLNLHGRHPIWAERGRCLEALRILVDVWNAEWGAIDSARRWERAPARGEPGAVETSPQGEWMYWARPGAMRKWLHGPWAPYEPPAVVEPWLGGQLSTWPNEAVLKALEP